MLDPGHGGKDPGAVGPTGLREADVVLEVSKLTRTLLHGLTYQVHLTRADDRYISLSQRAAFANRLDAVLFVSIHCNSVKDPTAHGTETWYYSYSKEGQQLAQSIQTQLIGWIGRRDRGIRPTSSLRVLRQTTMPAALAELAFISNDVEEVLLRSYDIRMVAARALAQGIGTYARALSKRKGGDWK